MKIVDIHRKEIVYRKAVARAIIEVEDRRSIDEIYKNLNDIVKIAEKGVRTAWLHIPLLHPLPITRIEVDLQNIDNNIEITCSGETYYKTGIEMDTLYGTACVTSYIIHLLKGKAYLKEMNVVEKVKRDLKEDIDDLNGAITISIETTLNMKTLTTRVVRSYTCVGYLKLREETINKILRKEVEKGDPLVIGELSCLENVKRFSEIIGEVFHVLNAKSRADVVGRDTLRMILEVKTVEDSWGPVTHGVLSGLIAMWDVVKKYEKDSSGQYPNAKIIDVKLLEGS
ncbi:MAG: hypothetical protein GXO10_07115 [Crenarchaeota archaeon]|nr:hypothetical protein [Thermoproteota archaeon]